MEGTDTAADNRRTGEPGEASRGGPTATVARWAEVHRLAVAGREPEIARDVGAQVARVWLPTSRFADVEALARATLTLGPDAVALYHLGWALSATGQPWEALACYEQALHLFREAGDRGNEAAALNSIGQVYDGLSDRQQALTHYQQVLPIAQEVGDRAGEAITLNNIGHVYDGLGDRQQALTYYQQALPTLREVGDRAVEAVTRYNLAMIHRAAGDLDQAVGELEIVVDLDRQVEHPDLASDTAELEQVRQERAQARTET